MPRTTATSGFVYIWRDRKNNRYYIGSHWGTEDDGYVCSSIWMCNAYNRRPEDFKRRIIVRINSSRTNLLLEEERWLQMIKLEEIGTRYYNKIQKTNIYWHTTEGQHFDFVAQKISMANKGFSLSQT